jgi:hypothetical protein
MAVKDSFMENHLKPFVFSRKQLLFYHRTPEMRELVRALQASG